MIQEDINDDDEDATSRFSFDERKVAMWGLAEPGLSGDRQEREAALATRGDFASALILQGAILAERHPERVLGTSTGHSCPPAPRTLVPEDAMPTRATYYARFSSEEQLTSNSIELQTQSCLATIRQNGWEGAAECAFLDRARSGTTQAGREGL